MKNCKKLLLTTLLMFLGLALFGQKDFKWDIIIDSLPDNQNQLFSKTKLFIAETWKSAQNVIQNDDKEAGIILVKGLSIQNMFFQLNDHRWTFAYTVKFLIKEGKCRLIVENVNCQSAICRNYKWVLLPVQDNYPEEQGMKKTNLFEGKYLELMTSLKQELQSIVDSYTINIKKPIAKNDDW